MLNLERIYEIFLYLISHINGTMITVTLGKTTFLGQASLDLAEQGINVLWGSFEIKNTRLMHKLLQQYTKDVLPVGVAERDMSIEEKQKAITSLAALADKFESLPMYFMKFHGGSDVDDVLDAMEYAAYVVSPTIS